VTAPSALHEQRVRTLQAIGDLAGFVDTSRLDQGNRPDVFQVNVARGRLLVGDAKASESPGIYATKLRLVGYLRAMLPWHRAGFEIAIILCVPSRDADRWLRLLIDSARVVGLGPVRPCDIDLVDGESVVSVIIET
jgi:hypothetical protein